MKKLSFIIVAISVCFIICVTAAAQATVNLEKVTNKTKPPVALKFIEGIEINQQSVTGNPSAVAVKENTPRATVKDNSVPAIEQCSAIQFKYAMLMNREVESITNIALYKFIDEWWATRYSYGGADKSGIDCSAFTCKVLASVYGITLPRTAWDQYAAAEKIPLENLKEGDLVFFQMKGAVRHVGVYLGGNYFVHSSASNGVGISNLSDNYYSSKFIGGGRVSK